MRYNYYKDSVSPGTNRVLVFGSNLAARHTRGWSKLAITRFDAGSTLTNGAFGMAYAIPIKDANLQVLRIADIAWSVRSFLSYAANNLDQTFWIARLGDDCTPLSDSRAAPLFLNAPENCVFPDAWKSYLEPVQVA